MKKSKNVAGEAQLFDGIHLNIRRQFGESDKNPILDRHSTRLSRHRTCLPRLALRPLPLCLIAASVTAPCASAQVVIPASSSTIQLQTLSPGASRFDAPSGTVVNAASGDGVSGSNAQNWTLSNEGSISGAANGVNLSSAAANGARVDNYGSVQGGASIGIAMSNGGTVYNHAGASVSGAQNGVYMAVDGGAVSNDGTISANAASGTAVNFISGGSFTQGASGLISGFTGIVSNGGSFVGTNAGTVAVTGVALRIGGGSLEGTFTNHVGATLQTSGNVNAVEFAGNTFATLVNNGTITSHATGSSAGVWVGSNASAEIDNAGGTITGPIGLLITGVGSVVNNSGTLTGTGGTAISVTGSGNLITLDTGSVLNGDLVVAAGTAGNKLSLKGTGNEDSSLVGLAGLTMAGTNWLLSGNVSTTGTTAAATTVRSGTLTITGALSNNGVGGGTTINAGGTLQIGNGGTTGSVSGNIVDNGALIFNRADAVNIGTVISGSGAVAQAGSGTLTLTSANSYTGGTHLHDFGGMKPTGNKVDFRAFQIYRIEGGKLAEHWEVADFATFQSQLTAKPKDSAFQNFQKDLDKPEGGKKK